MNVPIPFSASNRPRRAILFFLLLMLGTVAAQAQNNWTGNANNRDWNTAGNWASGIVPTATDDVVIPSGPANQPVLSTTATAKSVEVQSGASLNISSAGSLTVNNSRRFQTFTASFWNKGGVVSGGQLIINNPSVAVYGLVNSGNFDNVAGGQISIDGASSVGLYNIGGSFVNSATITIGASAAVGATGVYNQATFRNAGCGALLNIVANAVITNTSSFSNTGTIIENATGNSSISTNAGLVQNLNGGTFNIGTNTGVLTTTPGPQPTITPSPSLTINQGQSAMLTASGATSYSWSTGETTAAISVSVAGPYSVTGTIGSCASVTSVTLTVNAPTCGAGLSGPIWTGCVSTDWNTAGNWASGAIPTTIDDVVIPPAPVNQPIISTTATAKSVEVQSGASLSITAAGGLTINNFATLGGFPTAFYNQGTVNNKGTLMLGNTAPVGLIGLHNTGTFTNTSTLQVDRATNQGINNRDRATFTNTGIITIGASVSMGTQGIWNQATFTHSGGTITIDRITGDGLLNSGNFVNSATITVGASASVTGNGIANAGTFSNSACATLTVVAPINNSSNFTNAGLFTVSATRLHSNTGTLTNNGLISYPHGNPIPNVVNNDVVVAPISSCNATFSPALQPGGNNARFTVGITWYTDQALTQSGGTYDPTTNTFTATGLAQGSSRTLYFTATDNANGCTRTLSISVTASAIASLSIAANPSLTITQGNSTVLTASGADSFLWSSGQSTSAISVSVAGPYSVTGTIGSCSATASVTLTVNPPACGAGLSGPIWTGCVSTDWNTAGNWASGAIPTATDDVVIPAAPANQPVINTSVVAGSIRINSGGLLTINAGASLSITPVTNQNFIDGTLVNYGIVTVTAGPTIQDCLYNTGTVQNKPTGTIRLNGAFGNGIWNVTDGSNVTNDGAIIIGDNTLTGSSGILNYGTLINTATGTIQIDRSRGNALVNTKTVTNAGLIRIGAIVPPTGTGIVNVKTNSTNPDPVFTNVACGVIEVFALVINQNGTFTNNGLLTVNTARSQRLTVVRVNSPAELAKTYSFGTAQFGPLITSVNLTADAILVSDGTANATLGCNPLTNSAQLAGKIAVVDRGTCNFSLKVYYAQQAGAIAVVVLNNQPGDVTMAAGAFADQITIPSVIVSQTDGQAIKTALATGPVNIGINQEFPVVAGTTNNGVINYPQGNSPIPNVTNNDVIVAPISSCSNTFSPALQLGGNSNQFTIGTTWYKDQALTQPAGSYNQGTNTFTATNLAPGSSTLLYFSVADGTNGCTRMVSVSVTLNSTITASISPGTATLTCASPTVSLTASGGSTYLWDDNSTNPIRRVSVAGVYSVTVSNGAGCSGVASVTVGQDNSMPSVSISANPSLTITQGQSATLTAQVSGGTSPFTYNWSTSQSSPAILVSTAGPYSVTATGANSCSATASVTLTVNPVMSGPFAITGVTTLDCTPTLPNRFSLSFNPRYQGLNGQPVSFSVTNELFPTTQTGPYTLQLYTDNPIITLEAIQTGVTTRFVYNWLEACRTTTAPNTPPRVVSPIPSQTATVGQFMSYVIPDGTFTDDETPLSLRLSARGLPPGLSFSGATLSGTPSSTVGSPFSITITATDPGSLSVAASFALTVLPTMGTPPPTSTFSITGVTTISCTPVANRINLSFAPRYAGLNGQPIAFEVVNETSPTTDPAPYSLTLYRDNPVITLRASQTGSGGPVTFRYNWLDACTSAGQENTPPRLNEPVRSQTAVVGQGYSLNLVNTFIDQETPDQITLSASGLPAGLSLSGKLISGTVSSTVGSPYSVSLTATDGGGLSTSTSFTLTVVPASMTPPPSSAFSITGVTTVSCEVLSAGQRRLTFNPRYAGLDGSPVSFSVANELLPTMNPGPYVLNLYTDNPVITLKAVQSGVSSSFGYGWLSACNPGARVATPAESVLSVVVLGNPVSGSQVEVEVRGADGQALWLSVVDERGNAMSGTRIDAASSVERLRLTLGRGAGVYLLRVSSGRQVQTLKLVKQ